MYFDILDKDPHDLKAKQMIDDLQVIFKKNNSRKNLASKFWFVLALILSIGLTILFLILIN